MHKNLLKKIFVGLFVVVGSQSCFGNPVNSMITMLQEEENSQKQGLDTNKKSWFAWPSGSANSGEEENSPKQDLDTNKKSWFAWPSGSANSGSANIDKKKEEALSEIEEKKNEAIGGINAHWGDITKDISEVKKIQLASTEQELRRIAEKSKKELKADVEGSLFKNEIKNEVTRELSKEIKPDDLKQQIVKKKAEEIDIKVLEKNIMKVSTEDIENKVVNRIDVKQIEKNATNSVREKVDTKRLEQNVQEAIAEKALKKVNISNLEKVVTTQAMSKIDSKKIEEQIKNEKKGQIDTKKITDTLKEEVKQEFDSKNLKDEVITKMTKNLEFDMDILVQKSVEKKEKTLDIFVSDKKKEAEDFIKQAGQTTIENIASKSKENLKKELGELVASAKGEIDKQANLKKELIKKTGDQELERIGNRQTIAKDSLLKQQTAVENSIVKKKDETAQALDVDIKEKQKAFEALLKKMFADSKKTLKEQQEITRQAIESGALEIQNIARANLSEAHKASVDALGKIITEAQIDLAARKDEIDAVVKGDFESQLKEIEKLIQTKFAKKKGTNATIAVAVFTVLYAAGYAVRDIVWLVKHMLAKFAALAKKHAYVRWLLGSVVGLGAGVAALYPTDAGQEYVFKPCSEGIKQAGNFVKSFELQKILFGSDQEG